jgi:hypothetical protein
MVNGSLYLNHFVHWRRRHELLALVVGGGSLAAERVDEFATLDATRHVDASPFELRNQRARRHCLDAYTALRTNRPRAGLRGPGAGAWVTGTTQEAAESRPSDAQAFVPSSA